MHFRWKHGRARALLLVITQALIREEVCRNAKEQLQATATRSGQSAECKAQQEEAGDVQDYTESTPILYILYVFGTFCAISVDGRKEVSSNLGRVA